MKDGGTKTWILGSRSLIANPAEDTASRVDSSNHPIGTRVNIDQFTSDVNPRRTIIVREREDVVGAVDPHTLVLIPAEIALRPPTTFTQWLGSPWSPV